MRQQKDIGNVLRMLFAALRDMQWRKRRLVIAILSTAVIFGMTLVMTGLENGFRVEAEKQGLEKPLVEKVCHPARSEDDSFICRCKMC